MRPVFGRLRGGSKKPDWRKFIQREMPRARRRFEKQKKRIQSLYGYRGPVPPSRRRQILQELDDAARARSLAEAGFRRPAGKDLRNLFEEFRALQKLEQQAARRGSASKDALTDAYIHLRRNLSMLSSRWRPHRRFAAVADWLERLPHFSEWREASERTPTPFFSFLGEKLTDEFTELQAHPLFHPPVLKNFLAEAKTIYLETVRLQLGEKAMQRLAVAARHYAGYQREIENWVREISEEEAGGPAPRANP